MKERAVNEKIRANQILLILPDGKVFGTVPRHIALQKAQEFELDLVEMDDANNGKVVCKIVDYGKLKYEETKRQKSNNHHNVVTKEMHVSYRIGEHDLNIKNRKVMEFLAKKHKVLYVMDLQGREKHLLDEAKNRFQMMCQYFQDVATWESTHADDNRLSILLHPKSNLRLSSNNLKLVPEVVDEIVE
jgi:translation initiation factor IF-3